ncbi:MAG: LacI family DNA-binding transcriptional regulator [Bacillota bacterium]
MQPTIADVARLAGVSTATVSRVINSQSIVAPATRERVLTAVRELGYQPNALAASLVRQRSHTLGVVLPDISNPFFPQVVRGLEDAAHASGYNVILCNSDLDTVKEIEYFEVLRQKRVDGLIYHSGTITQAHLEAFRRLKLPVVLAATHDPEGALPCVLVDNRRAAREAMEHLISLGHRRVAVVAGSDPVSGESRLDGYRDALRRHGLRLEEGLTLHAEWNADEAYEATRALLRRQDLPTAIAAASDLMALGVMGALQDAGLRVPQDVSVIGFDNIRLAATIRPALTTMAQPMYEIGKEAALMLIRCLKEEGGAEAIRGRRLVLPHRLEVRQSTARPGKPATPEAPAVTGA